MKSRASQNPSETLMLCAPTVVLPPQRVFQRGHSGIVEPEVGQAGRLGACRRLPRTSPGFVPLTPDAPGPGFHFRDAEMPFECLGYGPDVSVVSVVVRGGRRLVPNSSPTWGLALSFNGTQPVLIIGLRPLATIFSQARTNRSKS